MSYVCYDFIHIFNISPMVFDWDYGLLSISAFTIFIIFDSGAIIRLTACQHLLHPATTTNFSIRQDIITLFPFDGGGCKPVT